MDTAADWLIAIGPQLALFRLHEAHVDAWDIYVEERRDELARLQEELEAIWAFHDDQPPSSAQCAGHQLRCERLCDRIAALKGQR